MRRCTGALLVLLASAALLATAQVAPPPAAPAYLLRMGRVRPEHSACVLVSGDGRYHFEMSHGIKVRIREGTLPREMLLSLEQTLSQDKLLKLEQADVRTPIVESDLDVFALSVRRPDHWQILSFPGEQSHQAYHDFLDPLLRSLDEIEKAKDRELDKKSAGNNCLPIGDLPPKQRADETTQTANGGSVPDAVQSAAQPYILQIYSRIFGSSKAEESCLIVYESGAYHRVRQSQKYGSKEIKSSTIDGLLSPDGVRSLRSILDAYELSSRASESLPQFAGFDITAIQLNIPRDGRTQRVALWKYFDARRTEKHLPGVDDHGIKLAKPLVEWMNSALPEKAEVPTSDPTNPKCLPAK